MAANLSAKTIAARLSGEQSPLRDELFGLAFDHVVARRVRDLVDVEATRAVAMAVLTEENLERIVGRHIKPGWKRYSEAAGDATLDVGALVPEEARQRIRDTLTESRIPRGKWVEGAVDPVLLRKLFAPVFAHLLLNFAKKMPLPGVSGGEGTPSSPPPSGREGGIAGRLAQKVQKRAGRLVDASKSVMGGLGAEMERRVQGAARDFSDGAVTMWREALGERLKSEEGRALVLQISQQATDHVMVTKLAEIHRDAERLPVESIIDLVPSVVAHAVPHAFIQGIVEGELNAFMNVEGDRTVAELLAELGISEQVRAIVHGRVAEVGRDLFASEAFEGWLERLLEADG